MQHRYVIGVGSNLGDRAATIASAGRALRGRGVRIEAESRMRETPPVGGAADLPFLNGAWLVATDMEPPELLAVLLEIETQHGRVRREKWGNRTLDLDVLLWSGGVHEGKDPIVPHPRLLEREFALGPAGEVAPEWIHPGTGRTLVVESRAQGKR